MEWISNISAAIDYREDNLDSDIDMNLVAKKACCSSYNFQRIFSYISGVTLAEYIRRRRMTRAAFDIQRTEHKIVAIGMKYGYDSAASFTRAFQKVHGVSPIKAREKGIKLK